MDRVARVAEMQKRLQNRVMLGKLALWLMAVALIFAVLGFMVAPAFAASEAVRSPFPAADLPAGSAFVHWSDRSAQNNFGYGGSYIQESDTDFRVSMETTVYGAGIEYGLVQMNDLHATITIKEKVSGAIVGTKTADYSASAGMTDTKWAVVMFDTPIVLQPGVDYLAIQKVQGFNSAIAVLMTGLPVVNAPFESVVGSGTVYNHPTGGLVVDAAAASAPTAVITEIWEGEYTKGDVGITNQDTDGRVSLVAQVGGTALSAVVVVDGADYATFDTLPADGVLQFAVDVSGPNGDDYGTHTIAVRAADAYSTTLSNVVEVAFSLGAVYASADDGRGLWLPDGSTFEVAQNRRVMLKAFEYSSMSAQWNGVTVGNWTGLTETSSGGYVVTLDLAGREWDASGINVLDAVGVLANGRQERFVWYVEPFGAQAGRAYGTIQFPANGDGVGVPFYARGDIMGQGSLPVTFKIDGAQVPILVDGATETWSSEAALSYQTGTTHVAELYVGDSPVASSRFTIMAGLTPGGSWDYGNGGAPPPPTYQTDPDAIGRGFFDFLNRRTDKADSSLREFQDALADQWAFIAAFWRALPNVVRLAFWSLLIVLALFTVLKLRS